MDAFGTTIPYLFAFTDGEEFSDFELRAIRGAAVRERRHPVLVARHAWGSSWLSWSEFLHTLGGAVPSWEALAPTYATQLSSTAQNSLPDELEGEAWVLFEDLVASGLEFLLGRRAVRLGGRRRGTAVSDIQVALPTGELLIVDTKASREGFNAQWASLRPLVEYTSRSIERQQGHIPVRSAVVVSSRFPQPADRLAELSQEFFAETGVPVTFMTADGLRHCVECLRDAPSHRSGIRWKRLFSGGLFRAAHFDAELAHLDEVRPRA